MDFRVQNSSRARALARDPRAVRAVRRLVERLEHDETSALDLLAGALPKLLGAEVGCAYRIGVGASGPQVDFLKTTGASAELAATLERFTTRSRTTRVTPTFDALHPPRAQRNVAVAAMKLLPQRVWEASEFRNEVLAPVGLESHEQARLLVCDGSHLLAWVGVIGTGRYGARELGILDALSGPIAARLVRELPLGGRSLGWAAFDALVEQIGAPAFVVRQDRVVVHANALGKRLLDAGAVDVAARIAAARAGLDDEVKLTPLALVGLPPHVLAVLRRPRDDFAERLARATKLWALTPRQAEVLALLVRGAANKEIAERLRSAVVTIEVHVSAVLRKAASESRAEVVARFWTFEG